MSDKPHVLIPTLTLQAIHPTLAAAAMRMREGGIDLLAACAHSLLATGHYAHLTHALLTQGIEAKPKTVGQLLWGRAMFSGKFPEPEILARLQGVPALCDDRLLHNILRSGLPDNIVRQEVATLGGSPHFRGDFSGLLDVIARLPCEGERPLSVLRHWRNFEETLPLPQELVPQGIFLLAPESFPIPPAASLNLFVRLLALTVANNPNAANQHRLLETFCGAYVHTDVRIRLAFAIMSPALAADALTGGTLRPYCLGALRRAQSKDSSKAVRHAARRALETIATEGRKPRV